MNYNDTHKQSDRNTDYQNDGDIQRHKTDESIGSGDTQESQCAYKENEKKHGGERENAMKIKMMSMYLIFKNMFIEDEISDAQLTLF